MVCKVTGCAIPQNPQIALLNGRVENTPKYIQFLLFYMLLSAKITIARARKQSLVSLVAAKCKISWIMMQQKLVSVLQDKIKKSELIWEPWAAFENIPL